MEKSAIQEFLETVKIQYDTITLEPYCCSKRNRYSSKIFSFKIPKNIIPLDYDKTTKTIEVEVDNERYWISLSKFFGERIINAKNIVIEKDNNVIVDNIHIANIETYKVKRTLYWKLIFESDLPF